MLPKNVAVYLKNLREVWNSEYGSEELCCETLKSTVNTLLARNFTNEEGISAFIKEVATKGGCTEKGVYKINSETYASVEALLDVITPIITATKSFNVDIQASFDAILMSK